MEKLTSRSNPKIKAAVSLASSAKERRETSRFFLEGARLCEDAADCGVQIESAFFTLQALEKYGERLSAVVAQAESCFEITEDISACLSDTKSPQGIFCVCKTIDKNKSSIKIDINGNYIVLDNIQNPDNLGAISRTAEALGISGIIVGGGCDIYNPKAQRAAMGSLLRLPVIVTDSLPCLLIDCGNDGMLTLASTPDKNASDIRDISRGAGTLCVVGNEGAGVSDEVMAACKTKVTIPMKGRAQSLNAAGAAAILMWEILYG